MRYLILFIFLTGCAIDRADYSSDEEYEAAIYRRAAMAGAISNYGYQRQHAAYQQMQSMPRPVNCTGSTFGATTSMNCN